LFLYVWCVRCRTYKISL